MESETEKRMSDSGIPRSAIEQVIAKWRNAAEAARQSADTERRLEYPKRAAQAWGEFMALSRCADDLSSLLIESEQKKEGDLSRIGQTEVVPPTTSTRGTTR